MVYAKDKIMQELIIGMFAGAFISIASLALAIKLYLK
jgi:formate/nitrite transporter FocA (FNT family)